MGQLREEFGNEFCDIEYPSRPSRWEGHLRTALAFQRLLFISIRLKATSFLSAFKPLSTLPTGKGFSNIYPLLEKAGGMGRYFPNSSTQIVLPGTFHSGTVKSAVQPKATFFALVKPFVISVNRSGRIVFSPLLVFITTITVCLSS